jgi:two-component system cell cycle sensor histidine kinase/response regulator CckA
VYHSGVTTNGPTKRTILVVEDDADLLKVSLRVLKLHGYEVIGATRCEDAIALIDEHDVDLLLTDVQMPGMDGDELAARMAESHPDLRILFTSGNPNQVLLPTNGDSANAIERKNFIGKPYAMSDLARRVEEVFAADPPAH